MFYNFSTNSRPVSENLTVQYVNYRNVRTPKSIGSFPKELPKSTLKNKRSGKKITWKLTISETVFH